MNEKLGFSKIRVKSPYPLLNILGLSITSSINNHGTAVITGLIPEEERDRCIEESTVNDPIEIYEIRESGADILIFSGVMTCITVRVEQNLSYLIVDAKSWTTKLDIKLKDRSFQDKNATYSDIITRVLADYPSTDFRLIPEDRPSGKLLVQYRETDWTFLRRLATHFNTILIPDALGSFPRFWLGLPHFSPKELEEIHDYKSLSDGTAYYHALSHGFKVQDWNFMKYEITTGTRLRVGDRVTFLDRPCIVEKTVATFEKSLFQYTHTLCRPLQQRLLLHAGKRRKHLPQLPRGRRSI